MSVTSELRDNSHSSKTASLSRHMTVGFGRSGRWSWIIFSSVFLPVMKQLFFCFQLRQQNTMSEWEQVGGKKCGRHILSITEPHKSNQLQQPNVSILKLIFGYYSHSRSTEIAQPVGFSFFFPPYLISQWTLTCCHDSLHWSGQKTSFQKWLNCKTEWKVSQEWMMEAEGSTVCGQWELFLLAAVVLSDQASAWQQPHRRARAN